MRTADLNVLGSAEVAADWMVDRFAVQRTTAVYRAELDKVIRLPTLRHYPVTDEERATGWTDEPFRLESMEIGEDDLAKITMRSVTPSV